MARTCRFITYYLQQTKGYSPIATGVAFLPLVAMIMIFANLSNIVLMPRFGPKPLVTLGMIFAACGMAWLTRIGVHSSYVSTVLPPLLVDGAGIGLVIAPSINTGTYGVAPEDAGVASASVNTGQQLGGSIGTSLLNTVAASATAAYVTAHVSPRTLVGGKPTPTLTTLALVHGYSRAFWWGVAIFAFGAVVAAVLFRWGPLPPEGQPVPSGTAEATGAAAQGSPEPGVIPG